jgi:hypothetical protein
VRWMPVRWGSVQVMRSETSYQMVTVSLSRRAGAAAEQPAVQADLRGVAR